MSRFISQILLVVCLVVLSVCAYGLFSLKKYDSNSNQNDKMINDNFGTQRVVALFTSELFVSNDSNMVSLAKMSVTNRLSEIGRHNYVKLAKLKYNGAGDPPWSRDNRQVYAEITLGGTSSQQEATLRDIKAMPNPMLGVSVRYADNMSMNNEDRWVRNQLRQNFSHGNDNKVTILVKTVDNQMPITSHNLGLIREYIERLKKVAGAKYFDTVERAVGLANATGVVDRSVEMASVILNPPPHGVDTLMFDKSVIPEYVSGNLSLVKVSQDNDDPGSPLALQFARDIRAVKPPSGLSVIVTGESVKLAASKDAARTELFLTVDAIAAAVGALVMALVLLRIRR